MITEQRLSEIADLEYIPKPGTNDFKDLVRLARLGIWSLNHGIPALEKYSKAECHGCWFEAGQPETAYELYPDFKNEYADEALAQLPKQGEE